MRQVLAEPRLYPCELVECAGVQVAQEHLQAIESVREIAAE